MMDIWEKRALHLRRREELQHISDWLLAHPWWSRGLSLGLALAILLIAELLQAGIQALARIP